MGKMIDKGRRVLDSGKVFFGGKQFNRWIMKIIQWCGGRCWLYDYGQLSYGQKFFWVGVEDG